MYLESLHVENVGPFTKLDAFFNPGMNVVIGANGVGKTSLLKCITYCLTNHYMENIRFRKDAVLKLNCRQGEKGVTFGADKLVDKDQEYRRISVSNWSVTSAEGYDRKVIPEEKDYNLFAIGAYRYFSYRRMEGMKREVLKSERRQNDLRNNPNYLESMVMPDIKQWMINRYFQIDKEWAKIERSNWNAIMSNLQIIAPRDSQFKFVMIGRDLEPIFSLNGSECYLEELSSGFKSILSIAFLIVDWIEGVNEGDAAKIENATGTVLIDEIDAHLHPSWQSTILGSIRELFPNIQFIVTTHSPSVIMSANAGEVIVFNNNNGIVEIKPDERSFGSWQFNDILSDIMQAPGLDRISIVNKLSEINKAYEQKDIEKYQALLDELSEILNPGDFLLKIYNLRLSELKLNV